MFLTEFVDQVAAVAMQCEHLPDGDIQWLLLNVTVVRNSVGLKHHCHKTHQE